MTLKSLNLIPAARRDFVFAEIRQLVAESDAIDRSLQHLNEEWSVDDALAEIIIRLNGEIRRARKFQRLPKEPEYAELDR